MYRTFVIIRHTFLESVVQPIYSLLLALGAAILFVFAALPFFTLGEDTVMFKSVGLDVILLLVLIATLFATSKSIYEEIEDRTMLTLMSKPLRRWQVLVGKYVGIILAAALAVATLGFVLCLCTWWRIPTDYMINARSIDEREIRQLWEYRAMHIAGLVPSLVLAWFQIGVLAAVSVAISTRVSLVVNLPTVILVYIAGNLTRFLFPIFGPGSEPLWANRSIVWKGLAYAIANLLPFLEVFDLKTRTIYSRIALAGTMFAEDVNAVTVGEIWRYVGIAGLYGVAYATFALAVGMLLFQGRELGGGEG
ncbi:ABC transporter permease subunit [Fontivita pretiosa]|uniref:ABC transporter permease subunit n=1 Tax=Fontivita pretiosa TaxID=2989684 RepID=UPI003D167139